MTRERIAAGVICALLLGVVWARGQASVDESLETATIYVDASTGLDSNPGTQALPVKTIGEAATLAVNNNQKGIGTKVIINPGTYRESVSLGFGALSTTVPMTFESATTGKAIISGSDVWTDWTASPVNASIFTHAWPYVWGLCGPSSLPEVEQDIVRRREMIFVNGAPMTQVLSMVQMLEGTFFVDEANGVVCLWPPSGTDMTTATVEVATRPSLFSIFQRPNVVLRGLTFEHANSCRQDAAVSVSGPATNVLMDSDTFLWNNAQGLSIDNPASAVTVENSIAQHNGESGFRSFQLKSALWQSDTASYTNWRGALGAFYGFNSAGAHFFSAHDSTISGMNLYYNQTYGVHLDTDNSNDTFTSLLSFQNLLAGAFVETSQGPVTFSNSTICNGNPQTSLDAYALKIRNSSGVSLSSSSLADGAAQILVYGVAGGIPFTDWQTGASLVGITQNLTLSHDTIVGTQTQPLFSDGLGGSDWTQFASTLVSNNNTWWNADNNTPFIVPSPNLNTTLSLSGWQALTGQDQASVFAAPGSDPTASCTASFDTPDFWFTVQEGVQTVAPGDSATFSANVLPLGFSGTVQLSADGLESVAGAAGSWSQDTVATSGSPTFTVTTSSSTPPGIYPFTLLANSGSLTHAVTASLIVTGAGPAVSLSSTGLDFGERVVGKSSPYSYVGITNTGPSVLTVTSIGVTGDFSQTNGCVAQIPAGGVCRVDVLFQPTVTGTRTGTLTINDNASGSPHTVALTGMGVNSGPAVNLDPTSVTFGGQLVGSNSTGKAVTLYNVGVSDLTIQSMAVTGTNSGDFSLANSCSQDVPAGGKCEITVTFSPILVGDRNAQVAISDNSSGGLQLLGLAGTGADYLIAVKAGTASSASVSAGDTATFALTAEPTNFTGTVSFACSGAPPGGTCNVTPEALTLDGNTPSDLSVSVTTVAASEAPLGFLPPAGISGPAVPTTVWPLVCLLIALAAGALFIGSRKPGVALAMTVLSCALWAGCGGGSSTTSTKSSAQQRTPAGTYTLTVSAKSGNLVRNVSLQLTVQ